MIAADLAADEMRQFFLDGWSASAIAGLAAMPAIRWQGRPDSDIPDDYYVEYGTNFLQSPQSAHMTDDNGGSAAIFDTYGTILVTVNAPIAAADSFHIGGLLAKRARDIFRRGETSGGVWFRNARFTELGKDGKNYKWLVTVGFEFSET